MSRAWNVGGRARACARARAVGRNLAADALSTGRLAQARAAIPVGELLARSARLLASEQNTSPARHIIHTKPLTTPHSCELWKSAGDIPVMITACSTDAAGDFVGYSFQKEPIEGSNLEFMDRSCSGTGQSFHYPLANCALWAGSTHEENIWERITCGDPEPEEPLMFEDKATATLQAMIVVVAMVLLGAVARVAGARGSVEVGKRRALAGRIPS